MLWVGSAAPLPAQLPLSLHIADNRQVTVTMGRKGMKGFIKSAARPSSKPDEDTADEQPAESTTAAQAKPEAGSSKVSKQNQPDATSTSKATDADSDGEGEQQGQETRGQMLQRHKRVSANQHTTM